MRKNIDFGGCVLECSKSRVLKVFTIFTKSGFGGQLYFWNNVAQGVEMWRKFKRWICVSCKVPACIFNYSFCANQSFIHRPVWSIWDTRQDCSVNPLSLSYRRSYLWGQGFSTSNFWLLKDQRFERANICPICSNTSNTNSDTCFQTTFHGNFDMKLLTLYWLIVPWPPVTFTFTFTFTFPLPFSQTHFHLFAF